MDIKKPQLGKVEAFAFVFQREFCNTIIPRPTAVAVGRGMFRSTAGCTTAINESFAFRRRQRKIYGSISDTLAQ